VALLNVVVRDEKMGAAPSSRKKNEIQNIFLLLSIWLTIKAQVSHGKRKNFHGQIVRRRRKIKNFHLKSKKKKSEYGKYLKILSSTTMCVCTHT
jgi:hypothetical protein